MIATVLTIYLLCAPVNLHTAQLFAQTVRSQASFRNPHHHPRGEDVFNSFKSEITIAEANVPVKSDPESQVRNNSKTFRAFTTTSDQGIERIFFEDLRTHKTYEIAGVAWPNRPLNDPVFTGNYFVFDRSINPHRSLHYVFDLNNRVVVAARVF